ncbi:tetratricopeptide repeat protein [Almyronema epifaneia]|uniref:Tetratricopeptide repeat protein n=1 Tax=Almyronema epifaneia S1 TaxID=2991925 RepID=A0ABW6IGA0_9CYAN
MKLLSSSMSVALGLIVASGVAIASLPVQAQEILQQQGQLAPVEDEYTFAGEAGQAVTIRLSSSDFDPVLSLLAPNGEEIAVNDDYGGTLNSTIVITLPSSGTYRVVARSYSGQGGSYSLTVGAASDFEISFTEALAAVQQGEFEAAIADYTQAIEIEPDRPEAYVGRADAYFGIAYQELGDALTSPDMLDEEMRTAIASDYETAADLYEAQGDSDLAQSLREQATYIRTGETPEIPDAIEEGA